MAFMKFISLRSEGLRIEAWINPEHFCGNYS